MNIIKLFTSCCILFAVAHIPAVHAQNGHPVLIKNLDASAEPVYFNLEKGSQVPVADTAQAGWDLSFQHTAIQLQSAAGGQVIRDTTLDKIVVAPASGYLQGKAAIPTGSGKGWYTYNIDTHIISPIPGRVILLRTRTGKYVKLAVDSYYQDGPNGQAGHYTFHYTFLEPGK